jgi:hypothetical protein
LVFKPGERSDIYTFGAQHRSRNRITCSERLFLILRCGKTIRLLAISSKLPNDACFPPVRGRLRVTLLRAKLAVLQSLPSRVVPGADPQL